MKWANNYTQNEEMWIYMQKQTYTDGVGEGSNHLEKCGPRSMSSYLKQHLPFLRFYNRKSFGLQSHRGQ